MKIFTSTEYHFLWRAHDTKWPHWLAGRQVDSEVQQKNHSHTKRTTESMHKTKFTPNLVTFSTIEFWINGTRTHTHTQSALSEISREIGGNPIFTFYPTKWKLTNHSLLMRKLTVRINLCLTLDDFEG